MGHSGLHQTVGDEETAGVVARLVEAPGAGERQMGQRERRIALAGLRQRAAHMRRAGSVERAADRDRDERYRSLAFRRFAAPIGAGFGYLRSGAERQRAVVELRQSAHARVRSARGPVRAQRLDEHGDAPSFRTAAGSGRRG
ncbi:MAG: hypothetical protein ABSC22_01980 [Roseiarcus sp.]